MEKEVLLHKYFEGSLSLDEKVLFDQLLVEDANFKAKYEFEKDVQVVIKNTERNKLKYKLQAFEKERPVNKLKKNIFWKPLKIAASIALIIGASWFILNTFIGEDSEKLYASNYEKYPNTVYTITRGDINDNSLERKAFLAYEGEQYGLAITYFKELKDAIGLDYVDFYLAQSYLANNNVKKAIEAFEKIGAINSDYRVEALWYKALAYIKLEDNKNAIAVLEKILKEGSYKKDEALVLLQELQ